MGSKRRRFATEVLARPLRVHKSARDKMCVIEYADDYGPAKAAERFVMKSQSPIC